MLRIFLAALVAALIGVPSAAAALPSRLAAYCSPSGDLCYGAVRRGDVVRLQLTTAARYFQRYTLCVQPPAGARRCGTFPLFRGAAGSGYGSVRLSTFGATPPGGYRATWRIGSGPLGPTLRFRLP